MISPCAERPGVYARLAHLAAKVLKVSPDRLAPEAPLTAYGLDSLGRVELTEELAEHFAREVPETLLLERVSLRALETFFSEDTAAAGGAVPGWSHLEQMRRDSRLPPGVFPPPDGFHGDAPRNVLLTGATGFLGAHLLAALLRDTEAHIHCLARPGGPACARTRIERKLGEYGLAQEAPAGRVTVWEGDVTRTGLGLEAGGYRSLCTEIDTVFHAAASVDWVSAYPSLQQANVAGTLELLRLACAGRAKRFHFISTVSVCYSTNGPRTFGEDEDPMAYLSGIHLGYAQTKCVSEALVRQAAARGLPATVHRVSLISGNRGNGRSNDGDLLTRLIRAAVLTGVAPDLDWSVDCCPVDYVAEAVVSLACDPKVQGTTHIAGAAPRHWRELILWMNLYGHPVALMDYRPWLQRLEEEARDRRHPLSELRRFFLHRPPGEGGKTLPELYEDPLRSKLDSRRSETLLARRGLGAPSLGADLLERYFRAYESQGTLPPPRRSSPPPRKRVPLDLGAPFFSEVMARFSGDGSLRVTEVEMTRDSSSQSMISELISWVHGSTAMLRHYRLKMSGSGGRDTLDVVVKHKARDRDAIDVARRVAEQRAPVLGELFALYSDGLGLEGSHLKEAAVYSLRDDRFKLHTPACYGVRRCSETGELTLVLEDLSSLMLFDSAEKQGLWGRPHIEAAIRGAAAFHSVWYGRTEELALQRWPGHQVTPQRRAEMLPLWRALADAAAPRFDPLLGEDCRRLQRSLCEAEERRRRLLEDLPSTLIHNDFTPRNAALRATENGPRLCAYDWELATLGVPQHDLAEFLSFTLPPRPTRAEVDHYLEVHRRELGAAAGVDIGREEWQEGFRLALHDLLVDRFAMYALLDHFRPQRYLPRVVRTWHALYTMFPQRSDMG